MHKLLFIISIGFFIFMGCSEKDSGTVIIPEPRGLLEKSASEQSIAGEADALLTSRTGIEEKIIRTAYASIKTSRVEEAYDKALNLVKKYDGIILNASISKYNGDENAQLLIKILPAHFMVLIDELHTIGKVESKSISEEDVTEEYYDVRARLANAQKVRDRLFNILKKANKVEDILRVEKEIERVGEKIEVLEGKIRYFDSKVDYSRITINIYSKKKPFIDLSGIGRGFGNAIKYAIHFFFIIIWFIIFIIPLIIMIFILRPVIAFIIRRIRQRKKK